MLNAFGLRLKSDKPIKRITFVVGTDGVVKLAYWYSGKGDVIDHMTRALEAVRS